MQVVILAAQKTILYFGIIICLTYFVCAADCIEYLGCFTDVQKPLSSCSYVPDKYFNVSSNINCIQECHYHGYPYAACKNGTLCTCVTQEPQDFNKVPESRCDNPFAGDNQNCSCDDNMVFTTAISVAGFDTSLIYTGCYVDGLLWRKLKGYGISDSKMTPKICVDICESKGFLHAGVQNGDQCFCGDDTIHPEDRRPESECNSVCSGNKTFICGGVLRNSVYNTSNIIPGVDTTLHYVGCYVDIISRKLNGHSTTNARMTPEICVDICKSKGFLHAGVQNGNQCYCGDDTLQPDDKRPESECDSVCSGNKTFICGGSWRNSIYNASDIEPQIDHALEYKGCYTDKHLGSRFNGYRMSHLNMTPKVCVDLCKTKGYKYAKIRNGHQCSCGNAVLHAKYVRPESECNRVCSGNKTFICGGIWTGSVYITQYSGPTVDNNLDYQGCYVDTAKRKLRGYSVATRPMAPEKCVNICGCKGFSFAGVQYGYQCFCGNIMPHPTDRVPETECKIACKGSPTHLCGGYYRNSIYKIDKEKSTLSCK